MKTLKLICRVLLITLCVVITTHSQPVSVYNASWALLVGINRYEHLPPQFQLNGAINDVRSMRQLLIDHFGFLPSHIITLTDEQATKASILEAMSQLTDSNQIHADDRVLIYYSGHGQGIKLTDGDEMGFLISHDAKIDFTNSKNPMQYYRTCLGMDELGRVSRLIPAKHVLFLVDACYGGLAAKQYRALPSNIPNYLEKVANLRSRQVITAGKTDEQVFEERGHGIFTYKLLQALEHGLADQSPPDNVTTAMELASYLMGVVPADSGDKQHPHAERIDGEGEFLFVHRRQPTPNRTEAGTAEVDTQRPHIRILELEAPRNTQSFPVDFAKTIKLVGIADNNIGVVSVRVNGRLVSTTAVSARDLSLVGTSTKKSGVRFEARIALTSPRMPEIEIQATDAAGNSQVIYRQLTIEAPKPQPLRPDDMVWISAGEFMMGSSDGDDDAKPVHTVSLDAFYIDRYEVTNAQFKAFIDANPQRGKETIPSGYHNGDYLKLWNGDNYPEGKEDHPVVFVSWYAAVAYAQWVGKRLPTEAEWEKAARARLVGKTYAWGDTLDESRANFGEQVGDTTPVGTYPPNDYGLHDMAGNVWEWCIDVYDSKFYSKGPQKHPVAGGLISKITDDLATLKAPRTLRGGSWDYKSHYLQVGLRNFNQPSLADGYVGFRCVRSVAP